MDFVTWLESELDKRDWSQSDLSRKGDLTTAQISRVMTRQQNAGKAFLVGVAKAFRIPLEEVYRAAGELPPITYRDTLLERIKEKAKQIKDPRDIERLEKFIDVLVGEEDTSPKRSPRSRSAQSSP